MSYIKAVELSSGFAIGKAMFFCHANNKIDNKYITNEEVEGQIDLFTKIVNSVEDDLKALLNKLEEQLEKEIVESTIFIVTDPEIRNHTVNLIKNDLYCLSWAMDTTFNFYKDQLASLNDPIFADRITDLEDVRARLLLKLNNAEDKLSLDEEGILFADYLNASELLSLDLDKLKGLVLAHAGETSHIAILVRSLQIPTIVMEWENNFSLAAIAKDKCYLDPSEDVIALVLEEKAKAEEISNELNSLDNAKTIDGKEIILRANISDVSELKLANKYNAQGIGLFRTEFLLMRNNLDSYIKASDAFLNDYVVIRAYDLGGDKALKEDESLLGIRGSRYLIANSSLFEAQLREVLAASSLNKNIKLMFPFVTNYEEVESILAFVDKVKKAMDKEGKEYDKDIQLGLMIETPSSALISDKLASLVDFFSVGTNDLTQYTLCADRREASGYYDTLDPSVIKLLSLISQNAKNNGIGLSICGEIASNPIAIPLLIGLGYDVFSLTSSNIPIIKAKIKELDYNKCKIIADKILTCCKKEEINSILEELWKN